MRFGFSVLHYQSIEETKQCVSSILEVVPDAEVVVVDNASPNRSGDILRQLYDSVSNVTCISSYKNVGFARGNNLGYSFLRNKCKCDFISCINNDTLIYTKDFQNEVLEEFYLSNFAVMAPLVRLRDNSIQSFNPKLFEVQHYRLELDNWLKNQSYLDYLQTKGILTKLLLFYPKIASILRKVKQKFSSKYKDRLENVVLHGCFLIFSPRFIENFETAFDERTFMYREEELLYLRNIEYNLKTVYNPNIEVLHLEDVATNSIFQNQQSKYLFQRQEQITSLKILINELERVINGKSDY
jgi:possible glycosyltransferase